MHTLYLSSPSTLAMQSISFSTKSFRGFILTRSALVICSLRMMRTRMALSCPGCFDHLEVLSIVSNPTLKITTDGAKIEF